MNLRPMLGVLGLGAAVALTAAAAGAQTAVATPNAKYEYRQKSEANVAKIGMQTEKLIMKLQADNSDYGGHKGAAIGSLQTAQTELNAAAQYAAEHGYQMPVQTKPMKQPKGNKTHAQSDWSIEKAQTTVQRWITHLQSDSRDFGGHRAAAINALQQAETELTAATQFAAAHGH